MRVAVVVMVIVLAGLLGARRRRVPRPPQQDHVCAQYQLLERLGESNYGEVFRARHLTTGEEVALKLIAADVSEQPDYRERFTRECQLMSGVRHPRLNPQLDSGEHHGRLFQVSELVRGQTLSAALPDAADQAQALLRQLMPALAHAHDHGLVHRHLKPANVMLLGNEARIMDFGLARRSDLSKTRGKGVSNPNYMSPEQFTAGTLDARSDQYSFGVMAYELLTGICPFAGHDPIETVIKHTSHPAPVPTGLPEPLQAWLLRMLAKSPSERYSSMQAVAEAFEAAVQEPVRT